MPNQIPAMQNEQQFLDLQAAYSQAYDNVAKFGTWQMVLVIGAALAGPVLGAIDSALMPWGACLALVVLGIDAMYLEPSIQHYQGLGAKVHEVFDTKLFGLPWNAVKCGHPPEQEIIARLAWKFKARHANNPKRHERMRDWYPTACGTLPIEYGRLVCQRASMWWDADLRRQYCYLYIVLIFAMLAGGVIYSLAMGWTLAQYLLAVAAPLGPGLVKIWRSHVKHSESAADSDRARQTLQTTWEDAMNNNPAPEVLTAHSRHLQDELLDRRKNSSRIPNWFYLLKHDQFESEMNLGAEQMVKEAEAKLADAHPPANALA